VSQHRGKPRAEPGQDTDGCDLDFQDDPTSDADLPPASGGVQQAATGTQGADHEHADGCELDFDDGAPTKDEELPGAAGGVA
jgi:hypothetical protein